MDATTCTTTAASNSPALVSLLLRVCLIVGVVTVLQSIYSFLKTAGQFVRRKGKQADVARAASDVAPAVVPTATTTIKPPAATAPASVPVPQEQEEREEEEQREARKKRRREKELMKRKEEEEQKEARKRRKREKKEQKRIMKCKLVDVACAVAVVAPAPVPAPQEQEKKEEEEQKEMRKKRRSEMEAHAACCRLYGLLYDRYGPLFEGTYKRANQSELALGLPRGLNSPTFCHLLARRLREEKLGKMDSPHMSPYFQLYLAYDRQEGKCMPAIRRARGLEL